MGSSIPASERAVAGAAVARAAAAAPDGTQGLDVSHWQNTVDWGAVAGNGGKFAYMKATESTTYIDPTFTANYAGSANAGLKRAGYHFGLPDTSSGADQANFFLAHGGGWVNDGKTLPPVLDIEYNPYSTKDWAGWCYNQAPAQINAWISDFVNTVHTRTNRWPVIYTTSGWWNHCTGSSTTTNANTPLWIAPVASDGGNSPAMPAGWSAYTFYQWASSGTFPGDQDVFAGSVDQLAAFAAGSTPDKIVEHYNQLGGAGSWLGAASGGEYQIANGWAQNYANGIIYYSPATGAFGLSGPVLDKFQQLGGPAGSLGFPVTDANGTPDGVGKYAHFANWSSIYYTPNTGAHLIRGAIRDKWQATGWEQGPLGYPTTDETATADGTGAFNHFSKDASIYWTLNTGAHSVGGPIRAKWVALGSEGGPGYPLTDELVTPDGLGHYNHFGKNVSIYWTQNTGAHAIGGSIKNKWAALGWETGLGYPTTDETGTPDGVGRYNDFTKNASIYWTSNTDAHAVQGPIRDKWVALGKEQGPGYPLTDESITPDGIGHYNHFSKNVSIYWTQNTGAHSIGGSIKSKWAALGWEQGLGYPTTDESGTPDGVGRYNHFTKNASIYWTPNTDAHAIQGDIRVKWAALGWETGLGYPTTDESVTPDGVGHYNHFTNDSSIYWTPSTGAHSIGHAIRGRWAALGWETSYLHYPTSDEYVITGGARNDFQGGYIAWTPATGAVDHPF